jgi:hypothetical protein
MSRPWVRVSAAESDVREQILDAVGTVLRPSLEMEPHPDELAIVDAVLAALNGPPRQDWAALLLERIKAEDGMWTGQRAASTFHVHFGLPWSSERMVQLMLKLVERGQLVIANPPRGRTFTLPYGPGGEVRYEWTTSQFGETDPDQLMSTSEEMSRNRHAKWPDMHPKLLRREVKYGPWVEVAEKPEEAS